MESVIFLKQRLPDTFVSEPFVRFHNRFIKKIAADSCSAFFRELITRIFMAVAAIVVYPTLLGLAWKGEPISATPTDAKIDSQQKTVPLEPILNKAITPQTQSEKATQAYDVFPSLPSEFTKGFLERASQREQESQQRFEQEFEKEVQDHWMKSSRTPGFCTFSFQYQESVIRSKPKFVKNKDEYFQSVNDFKTMIVQHMKQYPEIANWEMAQFSFDNNGWKYNYHSTQEDERYSGDDKDLQAFLKKRPFVNVPLEFAEALFLVDKDPQCCTKSFQDKEFATLLKEKLILPEHLVLAYTSKMSQFKLKSSL